MEEVDHNFGGRDVSRPYKIPVIHVGTQYIASAVGYQI